MRLLALAWLLLVAIAGAYVGVRAHAGLVFQTDLMALLPQEDRDPELQRAKSQVATAFGRRIVLLIGHEDRDKARAAGAELAGALARSGLAASVTYDVAQDGVRQLGRAFFPFRKGLLADSDRRRLEEGRGEEIVKRALSSVFGLVGMGDAKLLQHDPFLLLPAYFMNLPLPLSRLAPDEGILSVRDGGKTYVLISAQLAGDVFALSFQDRFAAWLERAETRLHDRIEGLEVLRSGALFYAHAGANDALAESSAIGVVSLLGTVLLVVAVFRALRPLWLSILVIAVGVLCAFAFSLWLFGELHVGALLFGVSLIGMSVDYSLNYCAQRFSADLVTPRQRLHRAMAGIVLGLATTLIGYVTLLFAPFPGLHQVAVFSAVGVAASFITAVAWLPSLDEAGPFRRPERLLHEAGRLLTFWDAPRHRRLRMALAVVGLVVGVAGALRLHVDDDVRRLQPLAADLKRQEAAIQRLTGFAGGVQFFLVRAPSEEAALETEEELIARLTVAQRDGALGGFQAVAQFVPSTARQRDNRRLVEERLVRPYLARYYEQLGLLADGPEPSGEGDEFLTTAVLAEETPLSFARNLILEERAGRAAHLVLLTGVSRPIEVQRLADGVPGVNFVDPTGDVTRLLGEYRRRAVALLGFSALLMLPLLAVRYGIRGGLRVLAPSLAAVALAPALLALTGASFTFFNAMALILILAIGTDYAVFCREASNEGRSVTMLGVWLAMATTLLSFGLLALSSVTAVRAFGSTMLLGILLAFLLAPLAGRGTRRA